MSAVSSPQFDLITMGRSSIDLYANDVGSPFVEITNFAAYVGGSPTNIAVGVQRLNIKTALLTAVGSDPIGDFILNFLKNEGVETRYIPRKPTARSSAVILGIEPPDQFPLVFYRDNAADIQLTIDDVLDMPFEGCRAFEFAGTNLSREPSRSATFFAVERAKKNNVKVFFDIDFRADQWHDVRAFGVNARAMLRNVDVTIGTEEEILAAMLSDPAQLKIEHSQISAPQITGDPDAAIQDILALGPSALIVKRGAKGAAIFQKGRASFNVPGFPVEVYNILGAGDAFASGLIYGYLKGWDWYKAARMGNACGAIVVTRHGCANFMAYEEEALKFIEERGGF
ncbi:MAG TPA: 5-dehydro-2-deoxygluconokinase [Anaerolineales bacterium]|nr:5-dehydro-2-deoxygluconokinase [Anaerolineales bacterium]